MAHAIYVGGALRGVRRAPPAAGKPGGEDRADFPSPISRRWPSAKRGKRWIACARGSPRGSARSPGVRWREIAERLDFLLAVGLGYLSLDRSAATLSGGEAQRIRLATQIGSRLRGVLYVLDEPSIGLHARDNDRLLASLEQLRDLGNTVMVVEHDEETIRRADFVVDLGPGAGNAGGHWWPSGGPRRSPRIPRRSRASI